MLYSPECRKQFLNKEIKGTKTEVIKGSTVKYKRHVNAHPTNEEIATIESMRVL